MASRTVKELGAFAAAYARLNDGQREAVDAQASTVVIAGPGSGKTETLAVKAALLLQDIPSPCGIACIAYTRSAAREVGKRVHELGVRPGRRFVAGTLHAFCLRQVVQPYARLVGETALAERTVIGARATSPILRAANTACRARLTSVDLQVIRRASAAGEALEDRFTPADMATASRYDEILAERGLLDFDAMIHQALRVVQENAVVVELIAARFPWLLVDEYQDLGAPLHVLVQTLRDSGGVEVFAVGDPEQTILQFTGADSLHLESLEALGYRSVLLPINYRCAPTIVRAVAAASGRKRDFLPDPQRDDPGEVVPLEVEGGFVEQMELVVAEVLPELLARYEAHEVAIFYTGIGWYADQIIRELDEAGMAYSLERDARFSQFGEVVSWLQGCAQWSIDAWAERQGRFRDLASQLHEYLADAGHPSGRTQLATAEFLYPLLESAEDPGTQLSVWLDGLVSALELDDVLKKGRLHSQDVEALADLAALAHKNSDLSLQDFAGPVDDRDAWWSPPTTARKDASSTP